MEMTGGNHIRPLSEQDVERMMIMNKMPFLTGTKVNASQNLR